MNENQIKLKKY